jgi:hypothetical protein
MKTMPLKLKEEFLYQKCLVDKPTLMLVMTYTFTHEPNYRTNQEEWERWSSIVGVWNRILSNKEKVRYPCNLNSMGIAHIFSEFMEEYEEPIVGTVELTEKDIVKMIEGDSPGLLKELVSRLKRKS